MEKTAKVEALRVSDINPHIVIQTLQDQADDFRELYVVAITDDGPRVYATSDVSHMALAALLLQDTALAYLTSDIQEEPPSKPTA